MVAAAKRPQALQLIFAFFLGLMVTAFIGVGVYTFYPSNLESLEEEARDLRARQQEIRDARSADGLTETQQAELSELNDQVRDVDQRKLKHSEAWARTTSIILIILATLVMGVSLVRADQLPVISNGLLLGGVFTMLYGTGWTLASGDSRLRFWVMAFALLITLALGYARFVRERAAVATPVSSPEVGDLAARVNALEQKVSSAADAMKRGQ